MKTSTTLLIAAGAVFAVVGIGTAVYADSGWRGRGSGPCADGMSGFHRHGSFGGPMGGPFAGMVGPMLMKRVFETVDADQDGRLTQAEIDAFRTGRFQAHDANGDGRLGLDEFDALFRELTNPVMVRAFQFLDPNGDAVITLEEFEKPTSRIVQFLDRDGDGAISIEDRAGDPRHGRGPMPGGERQGN